MEDIDRQIKLAEAKMESYEVNSEPYLMYKEIRDELRAKKIPVAAVANNVRLHVEKDATCDGCQ